MDYSSRSLDQCDSMTILPNLRYTGTDLGDDLSAAEFDIGSKGFDLGREKPYLLLEDT
jgi:hypothetical protein